MLALLLGAGSLLLLYRLLILDPLAEDNIYDGRTFVVVLDHFHRLLGRRQVEQYELTQVIAENGIVRPRLMHINSPYRISLKLLALIHEDGIRLLIAAVKHVQLTIRGANQNEVVRHGNARRPTVIELSLYRQF